MRFQERERSERSALSDGEIKRACEEKRGRGEQEREIIRVGQVEPVELIIEVN